jgi:hypothetical protein
LYDWAGGMPAFEKLTAIFYKKVIPMPKWGWGKTII